MRKNEIGKNNEFPELVPMNQSTTRTGHIPMMSKGSKDAVTVKPTDQIRCKWTMQNTSKPAKTMQYFSQVRRKDL